MFLLELYLYNVYVVILVCAILTCTTILAGQTLNSNIYHCNYPFDSDPTPYRSPDLTD